MICDRHDPDIPFTGQLWPASNELCELEKQFIAGNNTKKLVEWQQFVCTWEEIYMYLGRLHDIINNC